MEEGEDTVMGDTHRLPQLGSFSQDIPQLHPTLAPSLLSSTLPASPSPISEPSHFHPSTIPTEALIKRDSLVEPSSDWSDEDDMPKKPLGLPLASLATGLCYDVRMRYHCEVRPTSDVHPEDPRRIYYIYKELCRAGLVDDEHSTRPLVSKTLKRIPARNATEDEISLVHTAEHFKFVKSTQELTDDELVLLENNRDSIYFNKLTFASSLLSAGGAIETCLAVAERKVKNAIAVIRPPGHHAENDTAMGFCLFNNVSVAARVCQKQLGAKCRKIMILDWDVHHGNGIQKAFYDDPNVLYVSLHVHQNGKFYPGGVEGDWDHCGQEAGLGKNINIPWADQGMGDGDYMFAFQQVVVPIAQEFDPDLVIVAAGFDAAAGDELGGCFVSPACYAHMTHMLMSLANGKLAVCLEGGYNFRSISKSALAVTKTLMGEPPDRLLMTSPTDSAIATVRQVMSIQSRYWRCMFPKAPTDQTVWGDRLHDVVRSHQYQRLYENFKLTPLFIYRTGISKSFEKQVLASPNYSRAVPLVAIFHDAPEIMGLPHPLTNVLEAHNSWMADPLQEYIAWIVGKGYAVIDVNIPKHVTRETTASRYEEEDEYRPTATEELASYLWDNYIEPSDATEIFLLGIGDAFFGVANLLINRENLYQRVNSVISFVAKTPIRAVHSSTQVWLSKWYRENSLVFVSRTHGAWSIDSHKITKRHGMVIQSSETGLSEMLHRHKESVFKWIADRADEKPEEEEEEEAVGSDAGSPMQAEELASR